MSKKQTAKRYTLFIVSLFLMGIGIAFAKTAGLGVSPISSVPNIFNLRFPGISMGNCLFIWNCLLVAGQILILRKQFQPVQLLQIPLSFLFGWFTDMGMWMLSFLPAEAYFVRIAMVLVCIVLLGFSIALAITADVVMNAGEGFVKALADRIHKPFSHVKTVFDIVNVAIALLLSLLFFHGAIVGAREGTVLCALFTGFAVKFFTPKVQFLNRFLSDK